MKVALLVEDRETGYVYHDVENAPPAAQVLEFQMLCDASEVFEESLSRWEISEDQTALRVVPLDHDESEDWLLIPTPQLMG